MFSHNNSYPVHDLPNRLRLPSGETRTDNSTFTQEELAATGWSVAPLPPEVDYPQVLTWKDSWVVRDPDEAEVAARWAYLRNHRNQLLSDTDYLVLRAYETGQPVLKELLDYRQALRDLPAKTPDPWFVVWPTM